MLIASTILMPVSNSCTIYHECISCWGAYSTSDNAKTGSGSRCINYFKICKLTQAIFAASDGDLDTRFLLFTSKTVHTWWFNGRIQWFHSSYLVVAESLVNELIESNVWASTITEGARLSTNQTLNSAKCNMNLYCYSYIILKIDYSSLHIRNDLRRNMISTRI